MEDQSKGKKSKKDPNVKKIELPRRAPSTIKQKRELIFITADKTTCRHCGCFPNEDPYVRNKKLNKCQKSPQTLYEMASKAVNSLPLRGAFDWSVEDVAQWISDKVGLPQYRECFTRNEINGLRLLMMEDPSRLPDLNIRNFDHILAITSNIRQTYATELVKFSRSVGLPPRTPLTHCTWFKSRTGPNWGVRKNWTRCDILRWMKIIKPEATHLDHWDLVWYRKPDYPKVKYARVSLPKVGQHIPIYDPGDCCNEYLVPRKFRILKDLSESKQMIWMEIQNSSNVKLKEEMEPTEEKRVSKFTPKKVDLTGLSGRELILARRRMPRPKFLP